MPMVPTIWSFSRKIGQHNALMPMVTSLSASSYSRSRISARRPASWSGSCKVCGVSCGILRRITRCWLAVSANASTVRPWAEQYGSTRLPGLTEMHTLALDSTQDTTSAVSWVATASNAVWPVASRMRVR